MQVLLKKDVRDLGKRGEVVEVAVGYGRNYLLPQGIAIEVDRENQKQIEEERKRMAATEARRKATLKEQAEALSKVSITISAKANEEQHLFGSIGPAEIVAALKEEGFDVPPTAVVLDKVIKELGVTEVNVKLDPEVQCVVKVWVVGE
jgi:large subunit ribosomal protein L9